MTNVRKLKTLVIFYYVFFSERHLVFTIICFFCFYFCNYKIWNEMYREKSCWAFTGNEKNTENRRQEIYPWWSHAALPCPAGVGRQGVGLWTLASRRTTTTRHQPTGRRVSQRRLWDRPHFRRGDAFDKWACACARDDQAGAGAGAGPPRTTGFRRGTRKPLDWSLWGGEWRCETKKTRCRSVISQWCIRISFVWSK
jgi:hypothetical protein